MSKGNWFERLLFAAMVVVSVVSIGYTVLGMRSAHADEVRTQWCDRIGDAIGHFLNAQAASADFDAWAATQGDALSQEHRDTVHKMIDLYFTKDKDEALKACKENEQTS